MGCCVPPAVVMSLLLSCVCLGVVVVSRVALAARIDTIRTSTDGAQGSEYRDDIAAKIAKWQQPPPAKQKKPLKAPDDVPKKKRGGKRYAPARMREAG